jgi:hypothetical protein
MMTIVMRMMIVPSVVFLFCVVTSTLDDDDDLGFECLWPDGVSIMICPTFVSSL